MLCSKTRGAIAWDERLAEIANRPDGRDALNRLIDSYLVRTEGLLVQRLRGSIPLRPLIVPDAVCTRVAEASRKMVELVEEALVRSSGDDMARMQRESGFHPDAAPLFATESFTRALAMHVARPDILFTGGEFKFIELNVGCTIGGIPELASIIPFYLGSPAGIETLRSHEFYTSSPLASVAEMLRRIGRRRAKGRPVRVAISVWDYEREFAEKFAAMLCDQDIAAFFATPFEFEESGGVLQFRGIPIDVVYKIFAVADIALPKDTAALAPLFRGCAKGGTIVMSDARSTLASNKRLLGYLSSNAAAFNDADRDFIERYVPWGRAVAEGSVERRGQHVDMRELLDPKHRAEFVLKPGTGYGGQGVVVGASASEREWADAVTDAFSSGDYLCQEFLKADSVELPFLSGESEGGPIVMRRAPFVWGEYVIGDAEASGACVRVAQAEAENIFSVSRGAAVAPVIRECERRVR